MNKHQDHGLAPLAWANVCRRQGRSIGLAIILAIFSFVLFSASVLITNIQTGIDTAAARMGADLMVVPEGYESEFEGLLLRSEPSSFYLDVQTEQRIAALPGVRRASSQLFLESLDAACCTVPVQLIAFDPAGDITISPWIAESYGKQLELGEVIIGSLILAEPGDSVVFYGETFRVAAKMAETGTGLDSSVFMTRQTADQMCRDSAVAAAQDISALSDRSSCVMVEAESGQDLQTLAAEILQATDHTDVIVTDSLLRSLSGELQMLARILYIVVIMLWMVAAAVLAVIFNVTINERRAEFGLYRALGLSRRKLRRLLLLEGGILSLLGSAAGIFAGAIIIFPFKTLIASALSLPYLSAGAGSIALFIVLSLAISMATVLGVCALEARKLGNSETFLLMRDRL